MPTTPALRTRLDAESHQLDRARALTANTSWRGYAKADVNVVVDRLEADGQSRVDVHATERTKLYFGKVEGSAPQFEAYSLGHHFAFVRQGGAWVLDAAKPELDGGGPPMATQYGVEVAREDGGHKPSSSPGSLPSANVTTAAQAGVRAPAGVTDKLQIAKSDVSAQYDYGAMYNYAIAHWDNYNSAYRTFDNDCTNFISQIVEAGGWTHESGFYQDNHYWWYNFLNQTYSWAGAHNWGLYAQVYSHRTAPLANVYEMLTTDVLQADWENDGNINHTMIVTGYSGSPGAASEIFLTYHTTNRLNVPFWGWLLPQEPGAVWFAHRT
ncbi:amidase domain-containing protein [Lentzea sp.]|uniref:amidase domain-containing protein n=1 Tax=Lentzea sp. TaxID=56099 RepID=UPI002ED12689